MFRKTLFSFVTFALAVASAATMHLSDPTWVRGTELKPGDYKVQLSGDQAVLKQGKTEVTVPVKVEQSSEKYSQTQVRINATQGRAVLDEIRLGGTNTRLVIEEPQQSVTGGSQ
jgi:hypothetical protein